MLNRLAAATCILALAACAGIPESGPQSATLAKASALRSVSQWPTGPRSVVGNDPAWRQPVSDPASAHWPRGAQRVVGNFPGLKKASARMGHGQREPRTASCGSPNDSPAIQSLLDAGGTVIIPTGICNIVTMLTVRTSNTHLVGTGGGFAGDGAFEPGSGLLWIGAKGGTILRVNNGSTYLTNVTITGVGFESNNGLAAYGLDLDNVENSTFVGLTADAFSTAAFAFANTINNVMENYSADNEPGVTCNSGKGLSTNGSQGDAFEDGFITLCLGIGVALLNTTGETLDDTHENLVGNRTGNFGIGLLLGCHSFYDTINWITPALLKYHSVYAYGTATCGTIAASANDIIDLYDKNDNVASNPVVEPGATLRCTTDAGVACGQATPTPSP